MVWEVRIVNSNIFIISLNKYVLHFFKPFIQSNFMDEDRLDEQEEKNCGRRSRKDEEGRDYVCGCGKSYLSYPALYTHIKTKHDGQKPEGTLKINATPTIRKQASNNHPQKAPPKQLSPTPSPSPSPPPQQIPAPPPPAPQQSRLPKATLQYLQQFTTPSDFQTLQTLSELSPLCCGYTRADDRIVQEKVGEPIYEKYLEIIDTAGVSEDAARDIRGERICAKSEVELVMVAYLVGVGRFVSLPVMDLYMQFCRLFRDCYADHAPQIYQICFRHKEQVQHQPHRDDPYKNYEYSYIPSSSKSKSYLSSSSSNHHHQAYIPHMLINTRESKYLPIIVDFFVRAYLPVFQTRASVLQVLMYIAADFCAWVYRLRVTNIQVGFVAKPDFGTAAEFNQIIQAHLAELHEQELKKQKPKDKDKDKRKKQKNKKVPPSQSHPAASAQQSSEQEEVDELQNNEDEDSCKLGHEIVDELAVRDRSGSIHQYVNGGNQLVEGPEVEGEGEGQEPNNQQNGDANRDGEGQGLNDEEIQQYINT